MDVAVDHASRLQRPKAGSTPSCGVIARLEIFDDFGAAEPAWRALERVGVLATPYQRFDFLHPWFRHLGARAGLRPFLVVGYDIEGAPVLLCPFGLARRGPLRIVSFLGGRHASFNMALWRRDVAARVGKGDLAAIRSHIASAAPQHRADLLLLTDQPHQWDGLSNPLLLWPHQPSPSFGYCGTLMPDFDNLMRQRLSYAARKQLRKKARSLSEQGPMQFSRAATAEQARTFLDAFCAQKATRMRALGIHNIFAALGTRNFIDELATACPNGQPPLAEIYALSVGDTTLATIGGMVGGPRFCAMFNSITSGPLLRESPGDHLIYNLMKAFCERGLGSFDLGVGDARYKRTFCNEVEPLFDSFVPLTPIGRITALAMGLAYGAKRAIKNSPALWRMTQALRHARARMSQMR